MPSNHLILCRPLLLTPTIFPSIRVFTVSQLFTSGGQSIGVSASASILPMNIHDWFPLGWTGWISLQSRLFSKTTIRKHQFFHFQLSYSPTLTSTHDYWKNHSFDKLDIALTSFDNHSFVGKVMSLLLNMLSRFVITLLLRSKSFLTTGLQSPSAVTLEPPKNKISLCFHCFPIYVPWSDGTRCHNLSFLNVEF